MIRISSLIALAIASSALADPWPGYRGPLTSGFSDERGAPLAWNGVDGDNISWSVEVPGVGDSSPVVWDDHVFVTTTTEKGAKRHVIAYGRRTGRIDWEWAIDTPAETDTPGSTATPVTDGRFVYAWHGPAAVACYDYEGNAIWSTRLGDERAAEGPRPSPLLVDDLLINLSDGSETLEAIALDRRTGEVVWRRAFDRPAGSRSSASPVRIKRDGRTEVIVAVPGEVVSLNPQSGRMYWRCEGLGNVVSASPAVGDDFVVAYSSDTPDAAGPVMAIAIPGAGASGDVTQTHRKWWVRNAPSTPSSPVIVAPLVYAVDGDGTVRARDLATGDVVWTHDLGAPVRAPLIYASMWLYAADTTGRTHIFAARRSWKPMGEGRPAEPESTTAAPAFSDGQLFLRTAKNLYCVSTRRAT